MQWCFLINSLGKTLNPTLLLVSALHGSHAGPGGWTRLWKGERRRICKEVWSLPKAGERHKPLNDCCGDIFQNPACFYKASSSGCSEVFPPTVAQRANHQNKNKKYREIVEVDRAASLLQPCFSILLYQTAARESSFRSGLMRSFLIKGYRCPHQ